MPPKKRASDVRCVLCGGNHPAKILTLLQMLSKSHTNQPHQQTSEMQDLKNMMESLSEQMRTMSDLSQHPWNVNTALASAHTQTT
jgi:hypothetical protein